MSLKLIVKCVGCGAKEDASNHRGDDPPMCSKCYLPMLPVYAAQRKAR